MTRWPLAHPHDGSAAWEWPGAIDGKPDIGAGPPTGATGLADQHRPSQDLDRIVGVRPPVSEVDDNPGATSPPHDGYAAARCMPLMP